MFYQISKDFVIDARDRMPSCSMSASHSHQFNEIYFMRDGICDVWIEDKQYHLEPGCVLFIPAFLPHRFQYPGEELIRRTVLYLSTEQIEWFFCDQYTEEIKALFQDRIIILSRKSMTTINALLQKILFEKYNLDELSAPMTKSYFFELFIFLIRCHKYMAVMNQKTDLSNITIGSELHFIDDHYAENLTLPELAKKFGMSESSLSKKIKIFTELTFKEYLNKTRINASKHLLTTTNMSITQISSLCGYNNSNFFGDTFHKCVGMSPSNYRKMLTVN